MIEPHGFENTGALEMPPDPRDRLLVGAAAEYPDTYTNAQGWNLYVHYQKHQPACGPHSGAHAKAILDSFESPGKKKYSPRFNWIDIKTFDGYALEDGTDMRSIFKSLKNAGALKFDELGNDADLTLKKYADKNVITKQMREHAFPFGIENYAFLDNITFENLKAAIYSKKAVILLMRIGPSWWTDKKGNRSWKEKDLMPLRPLTEITSGHFVVAHSYDKDYIYFANSWSSDWGRKGHGYFGRDYMPFINGAGTAVDKDDADVVVPVFKFTKDLEYGMTDIDVQELQKYLNRNGFPVAAAGKPGSPGFETRYFGTATRSALIRYQTVFGIKPNVGYFGPITRKRVNGS